MTTPPSPQSASDPVAVKKTAPPNVYELSGVTDPGDDNEVPWGRKIVYSPNATGKDHPALSVEKYPAPRPGQLGPKIAMAPDTYTSAELRRVAVADLGTCVSFSTGEFSDGHSDTSTLVLPDIVLAADAGSVELDAFVIDTTHAPAGAVSGGSGGYHYTVTKLMGTAAVVAGDQ